ncbi:hypothetical protein [Stackebrandtia albiflava]|uniref:hypothetical protein n=1 Tax=Stackebrandtia albiflava TaxID=406432 RepID=UPI001315459B|nr:hypothetical protein [Stackebrandtia albiflava]
MSRAVFKPCNTASGLEPLISLWMVSVMAAALTRLPATEGGPMRLIKAGQEVGAAVRQ